MKITFPVILLWFVLASALLFSFSKISNAAQSVIDFTDVMTTYNANREIIQFSAADPLLTQKIPDNFSHIITLSTIPISSTAPILYFNLYFNGTNANCIVRLMNTTTKSSWVYYPVAAGKVFSQAINPNTLYLGYSSCSN